MGEGKPKQAIRARREQRPTLVGRILTVLLAIPAAYMLAALIGSFVQVNAEWSETDEGVTIYLANNGIHADIVMPAEALGLDWSPLFPKGAVAPQRPAAQWVAFGAGEERVYLDTPRWSDITPQTIWSALTGGKRVIHVEWVDDPKSYSNREIRLRPDEYRRLWASIRSDLQPGPGGRPIRIDHPGYGCCDAFYWATGTFNALMTCNTWVARRLHAAGIETSFWSPFVQGLVWRYRRIGQST